MDENNIDEGGGGGVGPKWVLQMGLKMLWMPDSRFRENRKCFASTGPGSRASLVGWGPPDSRVMKESD